MAYKYGKTIYAGFSEAVAAAEANPGQGGITPTSSLVGPITAPAPTPKTPTPEQNKLIGVREGKIIDPKPSSYFRFEPPVDKLLATTQVLKNEFQAAAAPAPSVLTKDLQPPEITRFIQPPPKRVGITEPPQRDDFDGYLGDINGKWQSFKTKEEAQAAGATRVEPNYRRTPAATNGGVLQEGKAFKFPGRPQIYKYEGGQLRHIADETTFKRIYGGLPEEGVNFTVVTPQQIGNVPVGSRISLGEIGAISPDGKLNLPEWEALRKDLGALGITNEEIEANFIRREGGDIFLRETAPAPTEFLADKTIEVGEVGEPSAGDIATGSTGVFALPDTPSGQSTENLLNSFQSELESKRATLDAVLKTQLATATQNVTDLKKELEDIRKEQKITIEEAGDVLEPWRQKLEESERIRFKIEENFFNNQRSVTELETLLNQAMTDIEAAKAKTGLAVIREPRILKIQEDYAARVGVIEAVMAARNNQISVATNLINRTMAAIEADKQGQIDYYNSVLNFYDAQIGDVKSFLSDEIGTQKETARAQITLLESDMAEAQSNANIIKKLIIDDPQRAEEAGISLNDNLTTISKKLSDYDYVQEVRTITNDLAVKGLKYISNRGELIGKLEEDIIRITDSRGVERIYWQKPKPIGGTAIDKDKLTPEEKTFGTILNKQRDYLAGGGSWAIAFNTIKGRYPEILNNTLDQLLNKDKYFKQTGD